MPLLDSKLPQLSLLADLHEPLLECRLMLVLLAKQVRLALALHLIKDLVLLELLELLARHVEVGYRRRLDRGAGAQESDVLLKGG